jgi:hypothetical protein
MEFRDNLEKIEDKAKEDWEQTKDDARNAWDNVTSSFDKEDER